MGEGIPFHQLTTVDDLPVKVCEAELARFLGSHPQGRRRATLEDEIAACVARATALVRPAGRFAAFPLAGLDPLGVPGHWLEGASAVLLAVVTLGPALEDEIRRWRQAGELTRATLLDTAGSVLAEEAASRLDARCAQAIARWGAAATRRFSPGFGDWALSHQGELIGRLRAQELGISLTPSWMMIPQKTVSFAKVLGANIDPALRDQGRRPCDRCPQTDCWLRGAPGGEP